MERELRHSARVINFDTLGQYGQLPGYVTFHQPGPLKAYLRERLRAPSLKILYQPREGDIAAHLESVTRIALATREVVYAVDEVDKFCSPSWLPPGLYDLVNYGRHSRVPVMCTSRRPAQVARELTSQCAEMRIFRMTEPLDVRYFAQLIGDATAAQLPQLGEYQYLRWTDDGKAEVWREGHPVKTFS
jgi:hypothetical protein